MAGPVSGAHLNPAVRWVRKFFFSFTSLLLYGSQFSLSFMSPPLLYHYYVVVFTHCKYSPSASTALAAVGKFDWKKVKHNFLKQTFACFVFCTQIVFFSPGAIIPIYPAWSLYTCTIPGRFPRRSLGLLYL